MRSEKLVHRAGRAGVRGRVAGFSLIELMVAMVLGLIVIAGAGSVFLAGKRTYRTNQALGDVQTNVRVAYEMLARDIRSAGMTGCNDDGRIANVLNDSPAGGGADWFANWGNAVHGYDSGQADPALVGSSVAQASGTDSLEILGAGGLSLSVESHNPVSAQFKLNDKTSDLKPGDIIVVCDPNHAAITQITNYNSSNVTLVHNTGTGSPGNCSKGLGYPTVCSPNGNTYTFGKNSQISKLRAADWFIGINADGGRSLYRIDMTNVGGAITTVPNEMVRNVTDMQITYHQAPKATFDTATNVTDWSKVDAVRVALTVESTDQRAGTDTKAIQRTFTATTTIRNRVN